MNKLLKCFVVAVAFASVAISDSTSFTVHVIGDSTVQTYNGSAYPQTGWGQILGSFFESSRVKVVNHALGGRSSKTFIQEGRLETVKNSLQKGDFVLIQFGHNDRYFGSKPREVPFDSLGFWLQQYVDVAKSMGATPIFVTPMNMNMGANGRNIFTEYNVVGKMEELSKQNQIPYVNLNAKSYNAYSKTWNPAYVSRYQFKMFLAGEYSNYAAGVTNDGTTHFQESGSIAHCQWIAEELESALANESYISTDVKTQLALLVAALKTRYAFNVKTNISNSNGLITHNQELPGGAPLTLHVSPGSYGKKFLGWYDDDCNFLTADSNYYGQKTLYRSATYTAVFEGGTACSKTPHGEEEIEIVASSSSNSLVESSSSAFDTSLCFTGVADATWPSPIDLSNPEIGNGWTETNHEGYTGKGFFNLDNSATSKAVYNITSDQSAESARVMIRYSFVGTENRNMEVTIDNGIYNVEFPPTESWDVWDTVYIDGVWVDALDFKVTFQSITENGGPNIDMMAFDIKSVYRTGCMPAKVEGETQEEPSSIVNHINGMEIDLQQKLLVSSGGLLDVRVMNLLGKQVYAESRVVGEGTKALFSKNVSLPSGRYLLRVSLNGKVGFVKPIRF